MLARETGNLEAHSKLPKVSASVNGKKGRELRYESKCLKVYIAFSTIGSVQPHVQRASEAAREPGCLIGKKNK